MKRYYSNAIFLSLILLPGCATPGGSTLLASVVGASAGIAMGLVADAGPGNRGRAQNVFAGMGFGGLLGGGTGYLLEQSRQPLPEKKEDIRPTSSPLIEHRDAGQPVLVPPAVDGHFVDDQVRGNTFIPGHFEYQIKEPAKWQR